MIEPALIGDKSGSSPTDEKGTTSEEEQPEPVTEDESTAPATEDEDASDEPPGVGEEAKVCTLCFFLYSKLMSLLLQSESWAT